MIIDPAKNILEEYEIKKGVRRGKAPYQSALDAAVKQMLNPPLRKEWIWDTKKEKKEVARHVQKKSNKQDTRKLSWFKKQEKDFVTVYDIEWKDVPYKKEVYRPSPLKGMKTAKSSVKSSYLRPVLKLVMSKYLEHHPDPETLPFNDVYVGLTGVASLDYFRDKFNATVEKQMKEAIRENLISAGRLCTDSIDVNQSNNRFDNMGFDQGNLENNMKMFEEDSSDESSYESSDESELGGI